MFYLSLFFLTLYNYIYILLYYLHLFFVCLFILSSWFLIFLYFLSVFLFLFFVFLVFHSFFYFEICVHYFSLCVFSCFYAYLSLFLVWTFLDMFLSFFEVLFFHLRSLSPNSHLPNSDPPLMVIHLPLINERQPWYLRNGKSHRYGKLFLPPSWAIPIWSVFLYT